ncbi:MAG: acetyl-CoA carboxylase biotin carboxyl carrier protein subunit [Bacteroidota bacterium]
MSKKIKAKVNGKFAFEFTQAEIDSLDAQKLSPTDYHIIHNHQSFNSAVIKADFNQQNYSVKVNSNTYEVSISNDLDLLIQEMGLSLSAGLKVNEIKAPMPGLILDINVKEGDEVKEGDALLILEAMKMENTITAPRDAVIKAVSVQKGDTCSKNALLIEME